MSMGDKCMVRLIGSRAVRDTDLNPTMTRYNTFANGNGNSSGNNGDYDDVTLKLQKYSAIAITGDRVNAFESQYGESLIVGFEDVEVLDGIVFQRDDKPGTWKVLSHAKFFGVDEETGAVLNGNDEEMSAQDVLEHPRVLGFSETFGGTDYFYTPVGAVVEGTGDIATNDDLGVETNDNGIVVGEVSMLLSNKSWVRTFGKLLTAQGEDLINTEFDENGDEVPITDSSGWLSTLEPSLRDGIEGRRMELFVIEETAEFGGEEYTYTTPVLLDQKTGERITIDNDVSEMEADDAQEAEAPTPAADGGAVAESAPQDDAEPEATQEPADEPDADSADLPEELDDLLDYFARTSNGGEDIPTADEIREFAADEVNDADAVDWDAAAVEVERRA